MQPCAEGRLWVPLLNGMERLGVAEVVASAPMREHTVTALMECCAVLTEMRVSRGNYSDTVERVRRREPMRMAAEMLRAQLPPLTYSTGSTIISGILEPCYDVGGDAFDYAVNGRTAHLALFDAVGRGSSGGMRAVIARWPGPCRVPQCPVTTSTERFVNTTGAA